MDSTTVIEVVRRTYPHDAAGDAESCTGERVMKRCESYAEASEHAAALGDGLIGTVAVRHFIRHRQVIGKPEPMDA